MILGGAKKILLVLVLLALSAGCTPRSNPEVTDARASAPTSAGSGSLVGIDGFWVSEKYLASIKANRSPFAGNPESFAIDRDLKKLTWTNFHEGYWRNIFAYGKEQGHYYLSVSEPESVNADKVRAHFSIENGVLVFSAGNIVEQINERFVKIPDELPRYANKLLLAGKYKDGKGELYEFTEEGSAIWPQSTFAYTLVLDSSEADCPYIQSDIKDTDGYPKRFGYQWQSGFLHMFEIGESETAPISCADQPFVRLLPL